MDNITQALKEYPLISNYLNSSEHGLLFSKLIRVILLVRKHMGYDDNKDAFYSSMLKLGFDSDITGTSFE